MEDNITQPVHVQKSRYPGLVPFSEGQGSLFFGREREIKELYNLIIAEQLVVVFAKSGIGKSSLLHAGLFPKLRENNYFPIKIRFQNPEGSSMRSDLTNQEDVKSRFHFFKSLLRDKPPELSNQSKKIWTNEVDEQNISSDSNNNEADKIINTPAQILLENIRQLVKEPDYDIVIDTKLRTDQSTEPPRLWEYLKMLKIRPKAKPAAEEIVTPDQSPALAAENPISEAPFMTPVLVFDQFEEFFHYRPSEQRELLEQLAEVVHNLIPKRIAEWLRSTELRKRDVDMINWAKQPQIRCVIAIRDDKLAELDMVRKFIPLILKNRYKLHPLQTENARKAIQLPASADGPFTARPFSFDEDVLADIIRRLSGKDSNAQAPDQAETKGLSVSREQLPTATESELDGSQLQKVCMFIEKKVINEQSKDKIIVIDRDFIKPEKDIQLIIDSFYGEQLKAIGSTKERLLCRSIIENYLVSGKSRASVTEGQMKDLLKDNTKFFKKQDPHYIIDKLIEARLIKEEYTHLGKTYELSHETLVNSVVKYAAENKLRRLNKQKFIYGLFLGISILLLAGCMFLFYKMNVVSNKINLNLAKSYYQQGNHYYAFNMWDNYLRRPVTGSGAHDNIDSVLNNTLFFDISTGDSALFASENTVAVHERDNSINIWKIGRGKSGLDVIGLKHFEGANNIKGSESGRYIGYRTNAGELFVYDALRQDQFPIEGAQLKQNKLSTGMLLDQPVADPDIKMNFIRGGDFVGYLDEKGQLYIYNLDKRKPKRLTILKTPGEAFDSNYILDSLQISADQQYLVIQKKGTLRIWEVGKDSVRKVRVIEDVEHIYNAFHTNLLCYSKKDSLIFEDYEPVAGQKSIRLAVASQPNLSPDGRRMLFYNRLRELVLFNGSTNRIDTVIRDFYKYNKKEKIKTTVNLLAKWLSPEKIRYMNKDQYPLYYNVRDTTAIERTMTVNDAYTKDACTWRLTANSLYAFKNFQRIYTDTLIKALSWSDDIPGNLQVLISHDGDRLAYVTKDIQNKYTLKIINASDGKLIAQFPGFPGIGRRFTSRDIEVFDDHGRSGLLFYNVNKRDRKYYRNLYPRLSDEQQKKLGINIF